MLNSLRDHEKYISICMEFRCNLKCVHCMIEGTMDDLNASTDEQFEDILKTQHRTGQWRGLVLTGAEITLRRDLSDLAKRAKDSGFENVRIQTHGMHLHREDYARKLVESGVDEYFISVAGSDRETHDKITQVPGSWDKMVMGMENLSAFPHVKILTNTVVTKLSYRLLPDASTFLSSIGNLVQMEFWNYWPMSEKDDRGLLANYQDVQPYLLEAIEIAHQNNKAVEVKNFPRCMLGEKDDTLVNEQPTLLIDANFWEEFDRNNFLLCPHQDRCNSGDCMGLSEAYIKEFGDGRDYLTPYPLTPRADR